MMKVFKSAPSGYAAKPYGLDKKLARARQIEAALQTPILVAAQSKICTTPVLDRFSQLAMAFRDQTLPASPSMTGDVSGFEYVPGEYWGLYPKSVCVRRVACTTRLLVACHPALSAALPHISTIAAMVETHCLFFVKIPTYPSRLADGTAVSRNVTLFEELVLYARRAGLYIDSAGRAKVTTGLHPDEGLAELAARDTVDIACLTEIMVILHHLSIDPRVAAHIPDAVQWLFGAFLPLDRNLKTFSADDV